MWIAIAALSAVALTTVVGLLVARALGNISREISDLLGSEAEVWATKPLARETEQGLGVASPSPVQSVKDALVRS